MGTRVARDQNDTELLRYSTGEDSVIMHAYMHTPALFGTPKVTPFGKILTLSSTHNVPIYVDVMTHEFLDGPEAVSSQLAALR